MSDLVTFLRRASMTALKGSSQVTSLVPASRIFGYASPRLPDWPFIKHGVPIRTPREATCLMGAEVRHTVHGFFGPRRVAGQVVETGEDHAGRGSDAILTTLHNRTLVLPSGEAALHLINEQRIEDGEADAWHVVLEFRARIRA